MARPLRQLLAAQQGMVSRRQLLALGVTDDAIRHKLKPGGRWQRVLPGVYATFTGRVSSLQRMHAAILWAGAGAMLTGPTATRVYGLTYGPPDDGKVHVLVPWTRRVCSTAFVRVHRSSVMPSPAHFGNLPLVPPDRAVVDTCRELTSLRNVRALLCEVVQRGLATCAELAEVLDSGPSAGGRLPRRALADATAGCRSAPECELRDLVLSSRILPEALWNEPLPGGANLLPDACWPQARLVVEIDSAEWHRLGEAPERTERRRARLAALGWRVIPVSPRRLREEPGEVLREIEAAYLAGLERVPA